MAALTIRDDEVWAKHIGDPALRRRVEMMSAGQPLRLLVDGHSILFRKMPDGNDGRPTPALEADLEDATSRAVWSELKARRGETVPISLDDMGVADPYLAYLDGFYWEWNTPGDAAAFDDL